MTNKQFVIGSSNTDLVIYLDRIPKIGETVMGGSSSIIYGGKGANQAVSIKKAGGNVKFITQLGNDIFGKNLKNYFKKLKLPSKYILTDSKSPSGTAQIFVSKDGENSIAVAPGSNGTLKFNILKKFLNDINENDIILLQLEIPIDTVNKIINFAFKKKIRVILNPAPMSDLSKEILKKVWMITPNETETEIITGVKITSKKDAFKASKKLLDMGVQHVIVTLGDKGSIYNSVKEKISFCVPKVKAIDSTAAGDIFNGYLCKLISEGDNIQNAIKLAHAAASLSVTIKGAQTSIPDFNKTINFYKKNKEKFKVEH